MKVCDADFPPGTFDGSNYYQVCELDFDDVCASYPEVCDEEAGTITSDLCGANPEWCDTSSDEYNACAANLYDCMMDPDFDMCRSFPDLCGFEEMDDFEIPTFRRASENANTHHTSSNMSTYICRAQTYAKWGEVSALIDSLNYFYGAGIEPNAYFEHPINLGARKFVSTTDIDNTMNLGEGSAVGYLYVPDLAIFADYGEAEEFFDDIFQSDVEQAHLDLMGEAWGYGDYNETDEAGTTTYGTAYSHVRLGYQLATEEDPTTYIGIVFETEADTAKMVDGAQIINWAKYTLYGNDGAETEESYAVACIITVGDSSATEVHFYSDVIDIESMDDAELEQHRISDSPWELADTDSEWYAATTEGVYTEGYTRQSCLVKQEWEAPEIDASTTDTAGTEEHYNPTGFGWFSVESGVRYIDASDSEDVVIFDFYTQYWDVEYRAPETPPELEV